MLYQNSSKSNEESALLRPALSRATSRLSIISSLKSLLSLAKIEKPSKDEGNILGNLSLKVKDSDKLLQIRSLNFAIPPKKIQYSKFLRPFELLSMVKKEMSSKDGEELQHKKCSSPAVNLLLSIFTFFPVRCEISKCSQIRTLKSSLVSP